MGLQPVEVPESSGKSPAFPDALRTDASCFQLRQISGSTDVDDALESDKASSQDSTSRQVTFECEKEAAFRSFVPCGGRSDAQTYGSCFWVPPPPSNVCRIYHNRKKTSYTEHVVEGAACPPASKTLIQFLESESNPSRCRVMKAAFLEGDASEDSNLMDVLHATDANGWQPLLMAAQRKQPDAVSALLELNAPVDCRDPSSGWTPLMYAVANGDELSVKQLLKHGASVNDFAKPSDWNALCVAIMSNHSRFVQMLLEAGADLELIKKRHPGLAEMYKTEASKCLACDYSPKQCTICRHPGCRGAWSSGTVCSTTGQCVSDTGGQLLITAIQRGQVNEVDALLEEGASVDHRDPGSGWTPLMYAVAFGNMAIVRRLLESGASPDVVARPCCWNALCVALLESRWEVVDLLLDHGADIDVVRRSDPEVVLSCSAEVAARLQAAEQRRKLSLDRFPQALRG
mmetsp:Transcript_12465/g.35475  ORF Transcript_12465/g.35475 Transcript_12465/m.35475 type:complete len:459 (-) Transcript_12465:27-1403(-)